jgi:hypothetical protein
MSCANLLYDEEILKHMTKTDLNFLVQYEIKIKSLNS